jgi:hypothetical protein
MSAKLFFLSLSIETIETAHDNPISEPNNFIYLKYLGDSNDC